MSRLLSNFKNIIRAWNRNRINRRREDREAFSGHDHKLGVLGIMKNEAMNLDEWVQHYLSMGAGKIFLIDNGSTDDTVSKAKNWVDKGVVELVQYPQPNRQKEHYWSAFKEFKIAQKCKWLILADLDEFWFCPTQETIAEKLSEFRAFDVIYGNWRMFGSSGLDKHPASIRQAFTMRAPELRFHTERKYICRSSVVSSAQSLGVHSVNGARSERTISENEAFHLNHYPIQSLEYFQKVKMKRGNASSTFQKPSPDMTYFERYDAPCTMSDRLLADLVASGRIK